MQSSPTAAVTPSKELAYLALVPLAWEQAYRASGEDAPDTLLNHVGTQQDVSECLDNMIFQIQAAMACYPDATWAAQHGSDVHRLFVGRTAQQLQQATASMHVKEEEFQSIPVTLLPEADSMYDALDTFFDDEELVGEDGKPVRRSVSLVHAPPLLQMQVQRVQYDRARHRAVKNQAGIELEEHLYLDRYMDLAACPPDEAKRLATVQTAARSDREEIARLRTRLTHVLGDDQLLPGHMETLEKALTSIPAESYASLPALLGEDKLEALRTTAQTLRGEAEQIRTVLHAKRRQLQERWADERSVSYRLAAVFMHRGTSPYSPRRSIPWPLFLGPARLCEQRVDLVQRRPCEYHPFRRSPARVRPTSNAAPPAQHRTWLSTSAATSRSKGSLKMHVVLPRLLCTLRRAVTRFAPNVKGQVLVLDHVLDLAAHGEHKQHHEVNDKHRPEHGDVKGLKERRENGDDDGLRRVQPELGQSGGVP